MATMHETLLELAKPVVDEEIVEVQQFFPGSRWKSGSVPWVRVGRKLLNRARVDDQLPTLDALVVTPTRVLVYPTSTRTGRFELGEQFAAWPRSQIRASSEELEMVIRPGYAPSGPADTISAGMRTHRKQVLRLTLQTPDGDLVADLPAREHPTQHIAKLLEAPA